MYAEGRTPMVRMEEWFFEWALAFWKLMGHRTFERFLRVDGKLR